MDAIACSEWGLCLQDLMVESNKELQRRGQQAVADLGEFVKAIGKQNSAVVSGQ